MIIKKKEAAALANNSGEAEHPHSHSGAGQPQPHLPRRGWGGSEHLGCCCARLLHARCARFSPRPRIIIIYSFCDLEIPLPYQKNNESPSEKWALQKRGEKKKKNP